ncbi:alpha-mannosidase [Melioribacteraceae bacterium 4301-Me]|uniref:alpha-mannosidase n=1 Tax=Pyranulibacter aquaticus TaxID=3163344 RepID=UPI00359BD99F
MKKIFYFLLLPLTLLAQTNVDKIVEQLELISEASLNNWKYSTDFSFSASQLSNPEFDDSKWQNLKLNENIYPDSCWLRKVIELPEFIAGVPVNGTIKFLVSVDDYGYMFINGENKGKFPWDGEFEITQSAKPGEKFVLVIKAINTGGPLRLIRAKLDFAKELPIQKLVQNLILSLRTGQKLLSFDTYQTNARVKVDPGIDKSKINKEEKQQLNELLQSSVLKINCNALAKGDTSKFLASVNEVRKKLKPVAKFAKKFTLHFTSNAHIDAAWLWRKKETVEVCHNTFSSVINMFKARPDFTYTQSAAAYYKWMKNYYPNLFEQIKEYVKNGRWEIVGGLWVEPDCNLPSGDSWARQLLYAQEFFKENFGSIAKLGWNPDSFGYNWNLPQILSKGGIDAFVTQKIGWNDTNVFPYRVFWWESPDGTKILTYFPFDYVNEITNPFQLIDWMRQFEANTGFRKLMILFGVGDHGGGPSLKMMSRIDNLKKLDIFPDIEFGTAENYLNWLKKQDLSDLPVWNNELYLEYHRGTLTTQSNIKKWNRNLEVLLTNSEKFNSIANILGYNYPHENLKSAWYNVLFNQFHDILPGSGIREIYLDANKDYQTSCELGNYELEKSLKEIAGNINTKNFTGKPLVVFNPLAWTRSDIVKVNLPEGENEIYKVVDESGYEIPSQIIVKDKLHSELIFKAEEVPSLGYKTYSLIKDDNKNNSRASLKIDNSPLPHSMKETSIENEYFKVAVDLNSGWLKSIYDKRYNKELLSGYGNQLQLLEDKPNAWDAWNIGLTGIEYPSKFRKAEFVENGPVRTVIRLYRDYLKPGTKKEFPTEDFPSSFFTQDVILYKGIDRIDFKINVEWWEDKTMLKVAFPFAIKDTIATYEIPFGSIQRSTTLKAQWDKGKWEVAAQKWADLSEKDFGISLLNRTKYGYDIKENIVRLSLLRSPKWPDPTADRGDHSIEYSLYPHKGDLKTSMTIQKGYEYNYPLIAELTEIYDGKLSPSSSFLSIDADNIILTSFKKSESGNGYILYLYECKGKETKATLKFFAKLSAAFETNFLEEKSKKILYDGGRLSLNFRPNEIKTVLVSF